MSSVNPDRDTPAHSCSDARRRERLSLERSRLRTLCSSSGARLFDRSRDMFLLRPIRHLVLNPSGEPRISVQVEFTDLLESHPT